jgi:hypothetical protein
VELTARSDGRPSIVPKLPQQPDVTLRAPLAELLERGIEVLTPGNAGWRKMQSRHPIGPLNNISERSACAPGEGAARQITRGLLSTCLTSLRGFDVALQY